MRENAMRVLFLAQNFHPEQVSNNALATSLKQCGHEVDVLTQVPNYGRQNFFDGYSNRKNRRERWNGLEIYRAFTIARGKRAATLIGNYLCFPVMATLTSVTSHFSALVQRDPNSFLGPRYLARILDQHSQDKKPNSRQDIERDLWVDLSQGRLAAGTKRSIPGYDDAFLRAC
jgi:hypothetical protein